MSKPVQPEIGADGGFQDWSTEADPVQQPYPERGYRAGGGISTIPVFRSINRN